MATKGRLTMSGRREYEVRTHIGGYLPIAWCAIGSHYLAVSDGRIVERTFGDDMPFPVFTTYAEAQAAIEVWQRQHDERRRDSAESEA